ncbi:[NiFe]-hydrogenase assembly chaperone HybE [Azospirillum sp.]|uniref:[NiFe]-hydrogenase assembly chaperone HybE n=1 Tax=Azospirillum sp. TaxID=34012 RepID=UPI002D4F4E62|nr:[NiFe]-hydrogenase assembly chaperone HybE [Azospirillum sp.]HYD63957.1 [NiFe]-hydrogenase assembly chaperone HybE [Azospirillum sp.]
MGRILFEGVPVPDDARMECGICWHVYDPAEGDPVWQVPAGTPFTALPDGWSCPNCDAPPDKFMVLGATAGAVDPMAARVAALGAAYRAAAEGGMKDVPICNAALRVETVGFQPFGDDAWLGIVVTPWCMNAVLLPRDPAAWADLAGGATVARVLPSGEYDFLAGRLEGVGPLLSLSLFSPMDEFAEHAVAVLTAQACLDELLKAEEEAAPEPAPPPAPPPGPPPSRRQMLFGRGA